MTDDAYSDLIRALNQAGVNAFGKDPIVAYEELVTREDVFFAHAIHLRLD